MPRIITKEGTGRRTDLNDETGDVRLPACHVDIP